MKNQHDAGSNVSTWIEKAEHDLRNAEYTLTMEDDCPFDTVCFHAQQCAEKYLKALLVWQGIDFPRTHDLRLLMQSATSSIDLAFEIKEILPLNRYSIEARYPGFWEPIERAEAEAALAIARKVKAAICAVLPEEISD